MVVLGVMQVVMMGMLPDLSSKAVVMDGCVKLAVIQNFGLDKRVALQYRHTWVRATISLPHSTGIVARNPVPLVRTPSDWQVKWKI